MTDIPRVDDNNEQELASLDRQIAAKQNMQQLRRERINVRIVEMNAAYDQHQRVLDNLIAHRDALAEQDDDEPDD